MTATDYFALRIKINKCLCIKCVLPHIINYQHVSVAFANIIGVALQEYEEYNNLPHLISGNNLCYNIYV